VRGSESSSAGESQVPKYEIAQGGAEGDLLDASAGDGAVQRHERGARCVDRPHRAKPVGAEPGDEREVGQRLHVLDKGRRAAEPALEGIRGLRRRSCRAAAQRLQQCRLLAGDEAVGHRRELDAHVVPALPEREVDRLLLGTRALRNGHDGGTGTHVPRRGHGAVDDEVGSKAKEHLVLPARRLAFRTVGDDDGGCAAPHDAAQLRRDVECGSAVAPEGRVLHDIRELAALGQRPEPLEMSSEARPVVDPGENAPRAHCSSPLGDAAARMPFTVRPAASMESAKVRRSRSPAPSRTRATTRDPSSATTEPV
jgi:hypothetical protein